MVASVDLELAQRQQQTENSHIDDKIEYSGPKWYVQFQSILSVQVFTRNWKLQHGKEEFIERCAFFNSFFFVFFAYRSSHSWRYLMSQWPEISQTIALLVIAIAIWTLCWILMPTVWTIDSAATRMVCLFVGAQICGIMLRILQWPEMLGMLGFGVLFANIGLANFNGYNNLEIFFRWVFYRVLYRRSVLLLLLLLFWS